LIRINAMTWQLTADRYDEMQAPPASADRWTPNGT
jgi:hypothetical protein